MYIVKWDHSVNFSGCCFLRGIPISQPRSQSQKASEKRCLGWIPCDPWLTPDRPWQIPGHPLEPRHRSVLRHRPIVQGFDDSKRKVDLMRPQKMKNLITVRFNRF